MYRGGAPVDLGLLFGTSFPIVAVVSNSMEHDGSFTTWWQGQEQFYLRHNITEREFKEYPFKNGFDKGDIMILVGTAPEKFARGQILVFWSGKPYPIIHRIVEIRTQGGERVFSTKGDHNADQVKMAPILDETDIGEEQVIGRAVVRIPYLGYVKILFVDLINLLLGSPQSA